VINVIQKLAIQADETKRKITRESFLQKINRKDIVFSAWLREKFGSDYYARSIRRKYFRCNTLKRTKASRFFVIDMAGEYEVNKASQMLIRMAELFSHRELVKTPLADRFCPYVLLRGVTPTELVELKTSLWSQGIVFNDGYPFNGAEFSPTMLVRDPTKEQLWRIKFVPSDDQLAPTITAAAGAAIEVYDFYKTGQLDSAYLPKGKIANTIKSSSSYLLHEVMQP
jgi:hypothetical protein